MMEKRNQKLTVLMVLCFAVLAGMTAGCSSSKGFLGYLKFWGPRDDGATAKETAGKVEAFMSRVRPAKGNPDSHYRLAVHYQLRGRHQEAIEEFTKTIAIDPAYTFAYNGIGISCDNLKEFDRAEEAYRTAMQLAPGEHYAYNNLGYSLILKGNYEGAVEVLKEGLSLTEGGEQMRSNLALAYMALGKTDMAAAELALFDSPDEVRSTLEKMVDQLDLPAAGKTTAQAATPGISSETIAPVTATNRFVERITRSLRDAAKPGARSRKPVAVNLKVARLEPDFLRVTPEAGTKDKDPGRKLLKTTDGPSSKLIQEIFAGEHVEETQARDVFEGRQQWF